MSSLKELTNGEFYHYKIFDGGYGIVKAVSRDDAIKKIVDAYNAHGQCLIPGDINISSINQKPFYDAPDVLEIGE